MKPRRQTHKYIFVFIFFFCFQSSKTQQLCYYKSGSSYCFHEGECKFIASGSADTCRDNPCTSYSSYRYYNYNSKICISSCSGEYIYYLSSNIYVCYSSCAQIQNHEIIYEGSTETATSSNTCYQNRPSGCDYYYKKLDGVRKCTTRGICNSKGYKYYIDRECKDSCEDYYQIELTESSFNIIKCYSTLNEALLDTTNVKFCDVNTKRCWKNFPDKGIYFIKSTINSANSQYEVVKECPNFYYDNFLISNKNYSKCVDSCKNIDSTHYFFSSGDKRCKDKCSHFNKYYYDIDTYECFDSCESSHDKKFYYPKSKGDPKCYASCPNGKFHNYNSHIIIDSCGEDNSLNLYHKETITNGPNICYPSCLDIPEGTYKYELRDKTCQETELHLPYMTNEYEYYYLKDNGVVKYANAGECKFLNYIYLLGKECKMKCNDNYYKKEVEIYITSTATNEKFIKCFSNPDDCLEGESGSSIRLFYNNKIRMCWIGSFPNGYYINKTSGSNIYELVDECQNFYYVFEEDNYNNYCTPACKTTSPSLNLFFINGNKKCEKDCINLNKHYFDPDNNECLDSCKGRVKNKFQIVFPSDRTTALDCLEQCPSSESFYNQDSNVCIQHCGADGSNNKYHKHEEKICFSSCMEIPNGNFIYELKDTTTDSYSCYDNINVIPGNKCKYYYLKPDGSKVCQTAVGCKSLNFIFIIGSECRDSCDGLFETEFKDGTLTFYRCRDLDECLADNNNEVTYYNIRLKKCWSNYPSDYFIKEPSQSTQIEVVEECEYYYYKNPDTGTAIVKYCTDKCIQPNNNIDLYHVNGKKNCESSCTAFNRYFYTDQKECLDTCKGLPNLQFADKVDADNPTPQQCKQECLSPNKYYDSNSNICLPSCGSGDPNKIYNANGKYVCYSSCNEIPGGEYIYELNNVCYKSIPDTTCHFYYKNANGAKQCMNTKDDCISKNYKYFIDNECRENCDGYFKLEDSSHTFITCFETINDILKVGNEVKFYNIKSKICWKTFPSGYYINKEESEIGTSNKKYEVVEECDSFFYLDTYPHCVDKCTDIIPKQYFLKGQKICKGSCTDVNKYFYNPTNNECLDTCKDLPNLGFVNLINNAPWKCINKCDDSSNDNNKYYDYDTNICINKCGAGNPNYLFHKDGGKICFPSCKHIPDDDYKYELDDTTDNTKICKTTSNCDYFYVKKDGILKCATLTECISIHYNYLLGKECKSECDDFYKLEDDDSLGLVKCYKTKIACLETIANGGGGASYYNVKLKKCWKNFPLGYFLTSYSNSGEVQVECDYYYHEGFGSYGVSGKYYCIDKCKKTGIDLFYEKGNKKCENSCKVFNKFYKDDSTNECFDTCIGRDNMEFADQIDYAITDPVVKCKLKCDNNQHYNNGEKICLTGINCEAGKYIKNGETPPHICYNSCSDIPGGLHIYEMDNFCYKQSELGTNCPYYYKKDNFNRKCVNNILDCQNAGYNFLYGKECMMNCDDNFYKFKDSNLFNIIKCYDDINSAISGDSNIKYFDPILKECWKEIQPEYFIKNENLNYFEVVQVCNNFYYEKDTIRHINYCIDNCKDINYFFISDNKKCQTSCTLYSKNYYNENTNECLTTCSVLPDFRFSNTPSSSNQQQQKCLNKCETQYYITKKDDNDNTIYECVETCPTSDNNYLYIDIKTKECLNDCLPNIHYKVNNKYCYPKCNLDDGYKYINTDTFECITACPTNLNQYELLDTIGEIKLYLCKSSCKEDEFRLGDECVKQCPKEFNYIGHNRVCKENCNLDANGQHYYPINEDDNPPSDYLIYKCINSCSEGIIDPGEDYLFYTKSNQNECLRSCPNDNPYFYLDSNLYECLSECPKDFPYYSRDNPNYYKCLNNDICNSGLHFLDGNCVNSETCKQNGKNFISSNNICSEKCPENEIKKKNLDANNEHDGTYICLTNCLDYIYIENIEGEPECCLNCPENSNYIGKNKLCKQSCDQEDGLNFYELDLSTANPSVNYKIFKCSNGCIGDYHLKEFNNGNQCYKECTEDYPYLSSEEHLCYDNCLKSTQKPFTLDYKESTGTITSKFCSNECINDDTNINIYYGDNKVCIENCPSLGNAKIIGQNNKCVEKCDFTSTYHFQLNDKCVEECEKDDPNDINPNPPKKKRYSTGDYLCKEKCGIDENIVINGTQCSSTCDFYLNALNSDEYECIPSCLSINKFYYPKDNICLPSCNNNDKVVVDTNMCVSSCDELTNKKYFLYKTTGEADFYPYDTCVLSCPSNKPYILNNECVEICPDYKRYFQNEFTHGEIEDHKICLIGCPEEYPFYSTEEVNGKKYYGCKGQCETCFIQNEDELIIGKLCLNNFPDEKYKYILETEINNRLAKRCYEICPLEARYHFNVDPPTNSPDHNCYDSCPEESPYHERGLTVCKKQSEFANGGYILYDIKEWVDSTSISKCPNKYTLYSKTDPPNSLIICLNNCIYEYNNEKYFYLTPYNTCVKDCESTVLDLVQNKHLINDEIHQKCICENLFYFDDKTLQIICYADSIGKTCKDLNSRYPLRLNGTNQCFKSCESDAILNPSEDICFQKNAKCSEIDPNSKLITKLNGQKKCDCSYKFYFDGVHKYCLIEGALCPSEKNIYILDTMECTDHCSPPYEYNFLNFCFQQCPSGAVKNEASKTCDCDDKFWIKITEGIYECLEGDCPDDYPLYADKTKQCLKSCKGSYYPYLYENRCYDNCSFYPNLEAMPINSTFANYKCECASLWYYYIDTEDNNKKKKFCPVQETVTKCKDYADQDLTYLVPETKECVNKCPNEYPYYFNNICYTSCEYANEKYKLNIERDESSLECKCQNLWKIDPLDQYKTDKICYDKNINECLPEIYPYTRYLILSKKQCVENRSECPSNSFKFNYICYDQCPQFSLEGKEVLSNNEEDNICVCNTNLYKYLQFEKYGQTFYKCGLETCPEIFINGEQEYIRKNYLERENKCVRSCKEDGKNDNEYLYSFRNKCVQECPSLTITEYDDCVFYDVNDENKIDDLFKLKDATSIQAKELYEQSKQLSGFLMNKYDASLQIYAVDKFNKNKDFIIKSNLTYIDLGTCLDKIFTDKSLEENDKILIVKYDLLTRNHKKSNDENNDRDNSDERKLIDDKYLINPVEYEFYLERTNEKIEGSVCSPHEIIISYPIFFNKNKFNNFLDGKNENEYLKRFLIGKELHESDPEIDTFNKENKVYKELCLGIDLDRKDLVLEDRYNYLYPNNKSLCESNCTMNNTDFDLERINCLCTYKEVFDFNRKEGDSNDVINDPNFHKTTQKNANIEIIKCLSKLKNKNDIIKNEAFYFCGAVTIVEIIMAAATAIKGIKTISLFIKGMLGTNGSNPFINFQKNKVNGVSSTNRIINNPPKKENEEEPGDNRGNIVIKKKINIDSSDNNILNIRTNIVKDKGKVNKGGERNKKAREANIYNNLNIYYNKKAEFIPPLYNFKFFKPNDKGIIKKIKRSQIPFQVEKDTKILLEYKSDVSYDEDYLEGPFYKNQNLIEIIEDTLIDNKVFIHNTNSTNKGKNNKNNDDNILNIIKGLGGKKDNRNKKHDLISQKSFKTGTISNGTNLGTKDLLKIKNKNLINPISRIQDTDNGGKVKEVKNIYNITSVYYIMKREHTYLRADYEKYLSKKHPNTLATYLAEILDKIYFVKIFIFLKKFEILSIHLSLYMFYHILWLSFICGFFTVNTIKKIWINPNFPTMDFYLLYGFLSNIIVWVIYKIFFILLDNQDEILSLVHLNNENVLNNTSIFNIEGNNEIKIKKFHNNENEIINSDNNENNKNDIIKEKYEELIQHIKIKTAIFYIVTLLFTGFCFSYLVSFFAIYKGTKEKVLKTYYISIIEIFLIKFVYGLSLAALRIAGSINQLKILYNFVYICDKYLS